LARTKRGCGCAIAVLALFAVVVAALAYKFALPWWKQKPPPPSGKDLTVTVLDVGQGDSILVVSPDNKSMLIDAGDQTKGKQVVEKLKALGIDHLDYFVATHMHPDHIGGAPAVLAAFKVGTVLHNDFPPPEMSAEEAAQSSRSKLMNKALGGKGNQAKAKQPLPATRRSGRPIEYPTVTTYNDFKTAVGTNGAKFERANPGQTIDLGGGAIVTVLAPTEPFFTRDQMREGGNEPNANSVVMRLVYGDFSMLLPGDAEAQTERRLVAADQGVVSQLEAKVLKLGHHGSKYATTPEFINRVKPKDVIISVGEYNRYGQPSQAVLDRLKSDGTIDVYRTDLNGDITITSNGREYKIKGAKDSKDLKANKWTGREGTKDDSSRSGFISYGDFGPPPKPRKADR
jgi:competence protein ComEC